VDWASDEDSDEGDADDEKKGGPAAPADAALKKQVRLLDYACGTGLGKSILFCSGKRPSCRGAKRHTVDKRAGDSHDEYLLTYL